MYTKILFLCLNTILYVKCEYYDTYTGLEITKERFELMKNLSLVPVCAREVPRCDPHEPRRMDLSCNNLKKPSRAAMSTPFYRMLPAKLDQRSKLGGPLPDIRRLRVSILSDGRASSDRHTQLMAHYNLVITGDMTSVHDTVNYVAVTRCCTDKPNPRCSNILVPDDDPHLRYSQVRCMNLTVPITYQDLGCATKDDAPARVNVVAPLMDLSVVYGNEDANARRGRAFKGGLMRSDVLAGKEWPASPSVFCINNSASKGETRCHDSPAGGANALLGLNIIFIWLWRQHNHIARKLQELNPCWDDDRLYYTAREINIAYSNQIIYYEMMPEVLGRKYMLKHHIIREHPGPFDDYDEDAEPTVSLEYVTATRWFHTIQEGRLRQYTRKGELYGELAIVDMTLRTGALALNNTLQGITQGAFRQPGAAVDGLVDPDIGERILGRLQFASDVVSADYTKGRLLYLPSYNDYRKHCGLKEIRKFKDLEEFVDIQTVDTLRQHYKTTADIDLMVGITVEKAMCEAIVGPTLACIMGDQLKRWRYSDRFWYERSFTEEQLLEIRKMTLSKMMCAHADEVDEIQPNAFVLPGPGNEMRRCDQYEMPNLDVFKDHSCPKQKSKKD